MAILYYIIIVAFLSLVTFLILKKFKLLSNGSIPKEYRYIVSVMLFILIAVLSLLIYNVFFTGVHYNF